jgi:hypothetical protein
MTSRSEDVAQDIRAVVTPKPSFRCVKDGDKIVLAYDVTMPSMINTMGLHEPHFQTIRCGVDGTEVSISHEFLAAAMMKNRIKSCSERTSAVAEEETTEPLLPCSHHGQWH